MIRILINLTIFLLVSVPVASAAITSKDHPKLKEMLQQYPASDSDNNGTLTFAEYQAFRKSQGPRKRADGGEAGPISTLLANGDLLITDFEENNYGRMRQWGWTIEGKSFERDFATATRIMKRRAATHSGRYLLSSYPETDATTGRVVSPIFEIEQKAIQFQLSGGQHPQRICVNLVVDGDVLRTITGRNRDSLETVAFDVTALKGRLARLEIIDAHTGIWGHINVDRMVQTDHATARRVVDKIPAHYGQVIGTVQTTDGRRRGALTINEGRLGIDKHPAEISTLLLAICENDRRWPPSQDALSHGALRLIDGEVWYGKVLSLEDGQITLQSSMFKSRKVPLKQIASIEFKPGKVSGGEPGTMYRDQGEPIPGRLVWIREKDVAIDCALGIVPIPRGSIQRLVLAAPRQQGDSSQDEVGLVDGSLLRGTLTAKDDRLVLEHSTLGTLSFEWSDIRHVRRSPNGVIWLDSLAGKILDRVGPILPPPPPSVVVSINPDHLRAIRMMPRTVTQYELPAGSAKRTLRAILAPVPGCRADINVRVKDGDRVLWERKISASSEPLEVAVDLQRATKFTIEVDYGDRLAFPCGIDWRDAHVLVR